ncbi:hypothetical protein IAR55_005382 [Kwoniella newhampshirensis]|uniref:G protein-coupled receptor n=1 Tax=Kwoniella newhampshirensis TaxID=1651941 RepID=A0AAW0YM31_9TREE
MPHGTTYGELTNATANLTTIAHIIAESIVSPEKVHAFAALNFIGIIGLLALVLTLTLSFYPDRNAGRGEGRVWRRRTLRAPRDPCLINAFVVLILVDILNLLYYLAQGGRVRPKLTEEQVAELIRAQHAVGQRTVSLYGVCRFQAVLQAGSQAAQAATILALVIRLWSKTIRLSTPVFKKVESRPMLIFLLAMPYLCILGFVPRLIILTRDANGPLILPVPFYCSLLDPELRIAYQMTTLGIAILALIMELWTIYLVWYHFNQTLVTSRKVGHNVSSSFDINLHAIRPTRSFKRFFFVRVALFVCWTLSMIAVTLYQAFDDTVFDAANDLAFSCAAPMAFICFATQRDVLRIWHIPATVPEWRQFLRLDPKAPVAHSAPASGRGTASLCHRFRRTDEERDDDETGPELNLRGFLGDYPSQTETSEGGDEEVLHVREMSGGSTAAEGGIESLEEKGHGLDEEVLAKSSEQMGEIVDLEAIGYTSRRSSTRQKASELYHV